VNRPATSTAPLPSSRKPDASTDKADTSRSTQSFLPSKSHLLLFSAASGQRRQAAPVEGGVKRRSFSSDKIGRSGSDMNLAGFTG